MKKPMTADVNRTIESQQRPSHLPPPAPPTRKFEKKLIGLWQKELGIEPIGVQDDFFELDGDSVAALNILLAFESESGIKLEPSILIEHPTISALSKFARSGAAGSDGRGVVPIRASGSTLPVYYVPGLRGEALNGRSLAMILGDDIPFHGVQNLDVAATVGSDHSLENIARKLADDIRTSNPDGPYIMLGFCVGAILAYEIAQQLRESGADVPLLVMIDGVNKSDFGLAAQWAARLRELRRLDAAGARASIARFVRRRLSSAVPPIPLFPEARQQLSAKLFEKKPYYGRGEEIISSAYEKYRPRPYRGPIVLYTSEENRTRLGNRTLGWAKLATAGLDIIDVPGNHLQMMKPETVAVYGEDLRGRIVAVRPMN